MLNQVEDLLGVGEEEEKKKEQLTTKMATLTKGSSLPAFSKKANDLLKTKSLSSRASPMVAVAARTGELKELSNLREAKEGEGSKRLSDSKRTLKQSKEESDQAIEVRWDNRHQKLAVVSLSLSFFFLVCCVNLLLLP